MKQIAKFLVGSRAFFEGMEGFEPHDYDWLYVMDSFGSLKKSRLIMHADGADKILIPKMTKTQYIKDCIDSDFGMSVGKMFVPEFAKYIKLTPKDLKKLEAYMDKLDDSHSYYKIIYDAYIDNNDFTLTDEQRQAAFEQYKKYRQ